MGAGGRLHGSARPPVRRQPDVVRVVRVVEHCRVGVGGRGGSGVALLLQAGLGHAQGGRGAEARGAERLKNRGQDCI